MKRVLVVEPQSSGLSLLDAARRLGHATVVLTANQGERILPAEASGQFDDIIVADTYSFSKCAAQVQAFAASKPIDAVLPGFEYYVPMAARLGAQMGCIALSEASATAARLKDVMRTTLAQAGVRVPGFIMLESRDTFHNALAFPLPAVVKPTNLSGSLQVVKVHNAAELEKACLDIWLHGRSDLDQQASPRILVEQYIDGAEYSVEGFIKPGGETVFLSITRKLLGNEPWFVELGHIVNDKLDDAVSREIKIYVGDVIHALGLTVGPFHAEIRLNRQDGKPYLMEIGARLAGDHICELIHLATGVDLPEVAVRCALGEPGLPAGPVFQRSAGIAFFCRVPGKKEQAERALKELPGFHQFELYPNAVGHETPQDFSHRAGYVLFSGSTPEEVSNRLQQALQFLV